MSAKYTKTIAVNTRFLLANQLEGIGRVKHEILQRLVQQHPDYQFLFLFDRPYSQTYVYGDNVVPIVVPPPARHFTLWYIWFEWALPHALKKWGKPVDLFYSPDNFGSLRLDASIPQLVHMHDFNWWHYPDHLPFAVATYFNHYFKRYAENADHIATVSASVKNDFIKHYHINPQKISVVHNGVSNKFTPLSVHEQTRLRQQLTGGAPYFAFLSAIQPRKNLLRTFEAFSQFRQEVPQVHKLVLIGRVAWQSGKIMQAYEQHPFKDDILLLGHLQTPELVRILGAAEALLYVSLWEGFGLPILEGMAAGVPVITGNVSSMPEVAGNAALLVDPTDTEAITRAMLQLHRQPALRRQLIDAGKERIKSFSWQNSADGIWQIMQQLMQPR